MILVDHCSWQKVDLEFNWELYHGALVALVVTLLEFIQGWQKWWIGLNAFKNATRYFFLLPHIYSSLFYPIFSNLRLIEYISTTRLPTSFFLFSYDKPIFLHLSSTFFLASLPFWNYFSRDARRKKLKRNISGPVFWKYIYRPKYVGNISN